MIPTHFFLGGVPFAGYLGGGFKYVLFTPLFGEDTQFDYYFSNGLKPPTSYIRDLFF